jgi:hypothetical protein
VKILLIIIVTASLIFAGVIGYKKYRISTIKYSGVYQSLFDGLDKKKPELLAKNTFTSMFGIRLASLVLLKCQS